MKFYSKNPKFRFYAMVMMMISLTLLHPKSTLNASDNLLPINNSSLTIAKIPDTESNKYFYLIEARVIDAEPMDDQMLEAISPSLIVPEMVKASPLKHRQRMLAEYNQSFCFKRCHSTNDFSASDYTYNQWCQLIEKDGHSIFSKIPWENTEEKEKIIKYFTQNAKNASFKSAGIGEWD
jgi:hypothetical protein